MTTAARPLKPPAPIPRAAATEVVKKPSWTLADVVKGRRDDPYRLLVGGTEGIGKTTFAAGAPKPIFLESEDGSGRLNVARLPAVKHWKDVAHAVDLLLNETHDYQTLVIDTVDWLEPLCWSFICARDLKKNIESYGYGKGYTAALDEWRAGFIRQLERLKAKRMHVLMLAHSHVKTFKNPQGADYDRYQLQLNDKASGALKQWCDAVLFANYETYSIKQDDDDRKGKGMSTGARYLHTERTAAYDAKNRFGLPPQIALSWDEFDTLAKAGNPEDPTVLLEQINRQSLQIIPATQEYVKAAIGRAAGDPMKLSQLLHWTNNQPLADQAITEKEGE